MKNKKLDSVFKKGSKTYYNSSIFFPKKIRDDVSTLYGFVRVADDFVDSIPQQKNEFYEFKSQYEDALDGNPSNDVIIDSFITLMEERNFDQEWTDAFLHSMELDIIKNSYETIDELKEYLYGSAEVIGLMMAKIMDLPKASYNPAMHLGRSMQYINFIRDIEEDLRLNRRYFPIEEMEQFGLPDLNLSTISKHKLNFNAFINKQITRYFEWQRIAEDGFKYIPKRYLLPIKTASDMYKWTAYRIKYNPLLVYQHKIKPSKFRIFSKVFLNTFSVGLRHNLP